jgi:chitin disaccharide deacetylase
MPILIITADDYGYAPEFDRGILEAVDAGAVDSVSSFTVPAHSPVPAPLLEAGGEIGLHLDAFPRSVLGGEREAELMRAHVAGALASFEALFGRGPAYIDGHRECHAGTPQTEAVAAFARERGLPVRPASVAHRERLRGLGVKTVDTLIGRGEEEGPVLPAELEEAGRLGGGITEWMVHPGHPAASGTSSYNAGREEDLRLLLELGDREAWAERGIERRTHAQALGAPSGGARG